MRAIRYCLMQKGLSPAKIAILCGGPDWPTSVLCGILRVPLHEALIGTAPVLVLYLAYTVLAGAFTLKSGGTCDSAVGARPCVSLFPFDSIFRSNSSPFGAFPFDAFRSVRPT